MTRPTEHNVVATFDNMKKAREAMEELGEAGIEANDVSLVGAEVEAAAGDPDTRVRDMEVTAEVGKKAILGGATGSALGALAGAAAFAIPGLGPAIGTGIWAAAAAGAMAGGAVGGMVGGVASMDLNENWELTFQDAIRGGKALVAVHAHDDAGAKKAEEILEGCQPREDRAPRQRRQPAVDVGRRRAVGGAADRESGTGRGRCGEGRLAARVGSGGGDVLGRRGVDHRLWSRLVAGHRLGGLRQLGLDVGDLVRDGRRFGPLALDERTLPLLHELDQLQFEPHDMVLKPGIGHGQYLSKIAPRQSRPTVYPPHRGG